MVIFTIDACVCVQRASIKPYNRKQWIHVGKKRKNLFNILYRGKLVVVVGNLPKSRISSNKTFDKTLLFILYFVALSLW